MPKTLREVAGELGLSEDAVRKRLGLIRPFLNGSIRRGNKGAILLEDDAVEMLLRMEELRKEGFTLAQAAELLTASGEFSPESDRTPSGIRPDAVRNLGIPRSISRGICGRSAFFWSSFSSWCLASTLCFCLRSSSGQVRPSFSIKIVRVYLYEVRSERKDTPGILPYLWEHREFRPGRKR